MFNWIKKDSKMELINEIKDLIARVENDNNEPQIEIEEPEEEEKQEEIKEEKTEEVVENSAEPPLEDAFCEVLAEALTEE